MKIDVYSHILPEKYLAACREKAPGIAGARETRLPPVSDISVRLRLMDRFPDVLQVLTLANPPLEQSLSVNIATELAQIANDELAELVVKYPDKFAAAVASLPMNDMDAALAEVDRSVIQLGLKGVQIYSTINGESLDNPKFRPLFKKMAEYDLPIWIHPCTSTNADEDGLFRWPYETSCAMQRLVSCGIFRDYPNIKFVVHHCGAMVPFFEGRIKWLFPLEFEVGKMSNPVEQFKKFYGDTASYGSAAALKCEYEFFGADHMLFGTDAPMPPFGLTLETIKSVERMDISEIDKEKIYFSNAANLLRLAV